jgi:hypothetical protein
MTKKSMSSSELAVLWITYLEKTLILRFLEYFIEKSDDQEAKNIMGGLWQDLDFYVTKITVILKNEGAHVPVGFVKEDVNLEAPKLYDNGFDIMFLRILKEISMAMYTLAMNMSYREDIMEIFEGLTQVTQKTYKTATLYLLKRGILTLPPKVTMPKTSEFVESESYLKGLNPLINKRALNTIELGNLHHGIETNMVGLQLITGFAQCAKNKEVKQFFEKGMELSKKQIETFTEILLESDIQLSGTSGSTVTNSTISPFSEKLMMYCVYFLNGFGVVGMSFGSIFSLRYDLVMKQAFIVKNIFMYTNEAVKIMIKNNWFEEPPQMEDRDQIIKKH